MDLLRPLAYMILLAFLVSAPLSARGNRERDAAPAEQAAPEATAEADSERADPAPAPAEAGEPEAGGGQSDNGASAADEDLLALLAQLGLNTPDAPLDSVDFELPLLSSGEQRSLSSFQGDVVLLNFWASWCPPCIEEMPSMQAVYEELGGNGFEIVAVNIQEDPETVRSFMQEHGYDFPVLLDRTGRIAGRYGVRGIPTSYVVDPDGRLMAMLTGPYEWNDEGITRAFERLSR